ncbi:MAG: hypothetical protein ACOC04_04180 [Halothece sp.]
MKINELVKEAITTGCLTINAEQQLRWLLQNTKYGLEEVNAFMTLQQAAMTGLVKQESRQCKVNA